MKNLIYFGICILTAILIGVTTAKAQILFPDGTVQNTAGDRSVAGLDLRTSTVALPPAGATVTLFNVAGSGSFVYAQITQRGGANDFTGIRLVIDGVEIENRSFDTLDDTGLTQPNPSGTMLLLSETDPSTLTGTVGFPYPVRFEQSILLQAEINPSNTGIQSLSARLLIGE